MLTLVLLILAADLSGRITDPQGISGASVVIRSESSSKEVLSNSAGE